VLEKLGTIGGQAGRKGKFNELDGATWTRYSISVWDITKTPKEMKLKHPAMFPVELCKRIIEIYTHKGEVVLDPFMGSGSALIAAAMLDRKGIGVDVNGEFVEMVRRRVIKANLKKFKPEIYCGDSRELLRYVGEDSVDLVVTSPPYWSVHRRRRTADYKESKPYSELENDLGNIERYEDFICELRRVFLQVKAALKTKGYCVVVVMDIRVGSNFIPFHMDMARLMVELGFKFEDIIIWNRAREYNNLKPLGHPYKFIVNKVHEYIMIFRKP